MLILPVHLSVWAIPCKHTGTLFLRLRRYQGKGNTDSSMKTCRQTIQPHSLQSFHPSHLLWMMPRPASPPQRQSSAFTVAFWTADPYQILFWNLPILYIFKLHHTLFTMPKQKYSRCSLLGLTMTLNASSASFQCKSLTIWHTCDEVHISFIAPS